MQLESILIHPSVMSRFTQKKKQKRSNLNQAKLMNAFLNWNIIYLQFHIFVPGWGAGT